MSLKTVDEILTFAIQNEQDAADFYTQLAEKSELKHMKDVFLGFAGEERGHKVKLENIRTGKKFLQSEQTVQDLKLGDSLEEIDLTQKMTYQEALIVAMKAEKAAFKLYSHLASATDDAELKSTLLGLAQEEAKHKLRFEVEYDDHILTEN